LAYGSLAKGRVSRPTARWPRAVKLGYGKAHVVSRWSTFVRWNSRMGARGLLIALTAATLLCSAACATGPGPSPAAVEQLAVPGFSFATDTFAFRNDIRSRNPNAPDLYANYCFVLARSLRQFFAFARFDPSAPRLSHDGYADRIREVVARAPWDAPAPADDRIVIPGYPNLRALSEGEEQIVKESLGTRFWTWVHWTNWRVTLPVTDGHQAGVAREMMDEIAQGRLVQLLVTNWPKPELNHTVVAFEFREASTGIEFQVWDPNNPASPGQLTFDRERSRFVATNLYDTEFGLIRVFRMYYSPWL